MKLTFNVDNVRRSGCVNTIEVHFQDHPNIHGIEVDLDRRVVTIDTDKPEIRDDIALRLKRLGYPEKGSLDGLDSVKAKASSLVACAVGMMGRSRDRD
jgi:copper chaperone